MGRSPAHAAPGGSVPVPLSRTEGEGDEEDIMSGDGASGDEETERLLELAAAFQSEIEMTGFTPSRDKIVLGKGDIISKNYEEDQFNSSKWVSRTCPFLRNIRIFGVEVTPNNTAVAIVYFVQGVLGLSSLAVNFYLKDDLHLDPAEALKELCKGAFARTDLLYH